MEKIDSVGNEVSNLGPDMIYNMFPFLRFLPFTHSKKLNELLKTKQEMISILEQLSVYTIFYQTSVFRSDHDRCKDLSLLSGLTFRIRSFQSDYALQMVVQRHISVISILQKNEVLVRFLY